MKGVVACKLNGWPCCALHILSTFLVAWEGIPFVSWVQEVLRGKNGSRCNGKELGHREKFVLVFLEHVDVLEDAFSITLQTNC